jgi:hypothetical protein
MQPQSLTFFLVTQLWRKPAPDMAEPPQPHLDTIQTEYHPHSKLPPKVTKFEDYRKYHSQHRHPIPHNATKPWTPFRTRSDFEFAKIALDAALNQRQVDALLKVFRRCLKGEDSLDLKDHNELQEMWDLASVLHTRVCSSICNNCKSYLH